MHSYLKSIGFGGLKTEEELETILDEVFRKYTDRQAVKEENGNAFVEYSKAFGPDFGITLCGEMDKNGFHQEYYVPYFRGTGVTSKEDLMVEKHGSRESYAGVMEDPRVGVSLIFYVQNVVAYKKACVDQMLLNQPVSTTFSGLSDKGEILLPICKSEEQLQSDREAVSKRNKLIAAAKKGDEEAIESLTLEDMDTYSMISQRIVTDDILTIVDSYFMPYGIECDQYNVLGEILDIMKFKNILTGEEICQMTIESNDMQFDVCINSKDLLGEPAVGRRFKGTIWLQGQLHY